MQTKTKTEFFIAKKRLPFPSSHSYLSRYFLLFLLYTFQLTVKYKKKDASFVNIINTTHLEIRQWKYVFIKFSIMAYVPFVDLF
jgi:hypothetical protein